MDIKLIVFGPFIDYKYCNYIEYYIIIGCCMWLLLWKNIVILKLQGYLPKADELLNSVIIIERKKILFYAKPLSMAWDITLCSTTELFLHL